MLHPSGECRRSPPSRISLRVDADAAISTAGNRLNQYLTKSKGGERIATDRYEEILRKVPQEIEQLRSQFGGPGSATKNLKLGDVPHMYSLIPLAQTRAAPIGELASRDGIVGSHYKMIENYERRMEEIAKNFVANTGLRKKK